MARPRSHHPRLLLALVVVTMGIVIGLVDRVVGNYQQHLIEARREAHKRLERATMYALRADVADVAHLPDGDYLVSVYLENAFPERDLYAMLPTLRAFIQIGVQWQEIPVAPIPGRWSEGQVVKLAGRIEMRWRFTILPGREYAELLRGFWHVQFSNAMMTSDSSEPKQDVVERTDTYFIHLLPIGADIAEVAKQHAFPAGVPVFIPMPPH